MLVFIEYNIRDSDRPYIVGGCCIEGPSLRSTGRHDDLGQLRGALSISLMDNYGTPHQVQPTRVKKFAHSGSASKDKLLETARSWGWFIPDKEYDMSDAAVIAEIAYALDPESQLNCNRKQWEVIRDISTGLTATRV